MVRRFDSPQRNLSSDLDMIFAINEGNTASKLGGLLIRLTRNSTDS
jgi:hypothetical protein